MSRNGIQWVLRRIATSSKWLWDTHSPARCACQRWLGPSKRHAIKLAKAGARTSLRQISIMPSSVIKFRPMKPCSRHSGPARSNVRLDFRLRRTRTLRQSCTAAAPELHNDFLQERAVFWSTKPNFEPIKEKRGHYASCAVWADETSKPKENVGDLRIFDPRI